MSACCSGPSPNSLTDDPYLAPFRPHLAARAALADSRERALTGGRMSLPAFASGHEYYGLHRRGDRWILREWAPNAHRVVLTGTFCDWRILGEYALTRITPHGDWAIELPAATLRHRDLYKLHVEWDGGSGERIPAYARRVVQDPHTHIFSAQVWAPEAPYVWAHDPPAPPAFPLIYEAHVGMAQEAARVGTYAEFRDSLLPRVAAAGYNTLQLMAIMEHPYYGSFGYQVSSFFAASSRFGTPEELKSLVDAAHGLGLRVIMDLIHSHAVTNEVEGLSRFDGTPYQYFHDGPRGRHPAWDSRLFDYGKIEVLHFLLSNCRFWLDEYRFDGFRFDGVTSMLYHDHGLGPPFTSYERYFDGSVDLDALCYLTLANSVIHAVRPDAATIAEDVSGMPGLGAPRADGGAGFDYRLAMGVPDCWFKLVNDTRDEDWDMTWLWHELTNRRQDERVVSYAECHDQALVGGKTIMFSLSDAAMYAHMSLEAQNLLVDRGMALHKMIRLATLGASGHGYLNFMGNEFGHPEWIDFPREGNGWSYHYARRQWSLRDNPGLKYHVLGDFDREMMNLIGRHAQAMSRRPLCRMAHGGHKVLAFERGPLLWIFNFHPTQSFTDFAVEATPGRYELELDTDEPRFGGQGRIAPRQRYLSQRVSGAGTAPHAALKVYIPCRTALVLRRLAAS